MQALVSLSARDPQRAAIPQFSVVRAPESGELVLIRGLPGSGKSTLAKAMVEDGFEHFEADMYFTVDGVYTHDPARIRDAHAWCQRMTQEALLKGRRVVVSNTFTKNWEMVAYRGMTSNLRVLEARGRWPNIHGVPAHVVEMMARRWEILRP